MRKLSQGGSIKMAYEERLQEDVKAWKQLAVETYQAFRVVAQENDELKRRLGLVTRPRPAPPTKPTPREDTLPPHKPTKEEALTWLRLRRHR